jgi:hypothetical protein
MPDFFRWVNLAMGSDSCLPWSRTVINAVSAAGVHGVFAIADLGQFQIDQITL